MDKQDFSKDWIKKANEDYEYATWTLENSKDNFFSFILFHYNQAVEKYLKAYILYLKLPLKKIHDLTELTKMIKERDESVEGIEEETLFLNDFYIDTRYPVYWPVGYTKKLCYQSKEAVEKIRDFIRKKYNQS